MRNRSQASRLRLEMGHLTSSVRQTFRSAQLYIGFHRNKNGERREEPKVWPQKNANATIHTDPTEQEAFLIVKTADQETPRDIQIKLRPDMVVLRRDPDTCWEGVKIIEHSVDVAVGKITITINADGSVTRTDVIVS